MVEYKLLTKSEAQVREFMVKPFVKRNALVALLNQVAAEKSFELRFARRDAIDSNSLNLCSSVLSNRELNAFLNSKKHEKHLPTLGLVFDYAKSGHFCESFSHRPCSIVNAYLSMFDCLGKMLACSDQSNHTGRH